MNDFLDRFDEEPDGELSECCNAPMVLEMEGNPDVINGVRSFLVCSKCQGTGYQPEEEE